MVQFIYSLTTLIIMTGCATTNKGTNYSSSLQKTEIVYSQPEPSFPEAIPVIIHYPALVADNAFNIFAGAYGGRVVGFPGETSGTYSVTEVAPYVREAINKTEYLALEFYRILAAKLPEGSVVLAPQEIVAVNGHLIASALNDYPPSLVEVDLFAYRYPIQKLMFNVPLTFGDLASPIVSIRTAFQASPTTFGAISLNELYMKPAQQELNGFFSGYGEKLPSGLGMNLVDYLAQPAAGDKDLVVKTSGELPRPANTLLVIPLQNVAMPQYPIKKEQDHANSPFAAVLNPYANIVVDALNQLDHYQAGRDKWINYLALYDEELARKQPAVQVDRGEKARLALIGKYAEKERKFLAEVSQRHFKKAYSGVYGQGMRKLLADELDYIERMRDQEEELSQIKLLSALTVINSALGIASGNQSIVNQGNQTLPELGKSLNAVGKAGNEAAAAFQRDIGALYLKHAEVQSVMFEGEKEIQAGTLSELREKLKSHYLEKTSSYPPIRSWVQQQKATDIASPDWIQDPQSLCWLNKKSLEADAVRWTGLCASGKAEGHGLASFYIGDRYVGEYEGEMRDGLANGWGVRIAKEKESARFNKIEGKFENGQPVGIVLVNRPGEKPKHEEYKAKAGEPADNMFAGLLGGAFGGPDEADVKAFEAERIIHHRQQVSSLIATK